MPYMMSAKSKKSRLPPKETGTILLRQAEPKYKFTGRKLPKTEEHKSQNESRNSKSEEDGGKTLTGMNPSASNKPVAIVEASCQSISQGNTSTSVFASQAVKSNYGSNDIAMNNDINNTNASETKTNTKVDDKSPMPCNSLRPTQMETVVIEDSAAALALSNITNSLSLVDRLKEVEKERDKLKVDMEVQLQVNSELKRLLVASVGEDLGERVQRLVRYYYYK